MKKDKKLSLLLLLFFLSGTSGLAFEVLWVRLAGLGFGHTVAAVATVLAAFMAGLGLGAWAFGRLIDRMSRGSDGLALYALLEVGIGVSALTLTAVLSHLDSYQIFLYGILSDIPQAIPLVKAISVFGLLLVPTALMGGTLPVVTSYTEQKYGRFGRRLASLYAMNTLGAAAACLAADFCLVPVLGVIQTAALAACVNLLVGAAAWRLRKAGITQGAAASREEELMGRGNRTSSRKRHAERSSFSVNGAAFCLVAAMVCGFAGLGAEVVWTRLLLFYTGSRVQAFSLMLAVFLLFTALGSMLAARVRAKQTAESSLEKLLARVFQLWGFGMIFSVFPMVAADRLLIHLSHGLVPDYARPLAGTLLSAATMALPCMALGASFPLLGRLYLGRAGSGSGRAVGHTYLANTVGSIAGSLAAGFFLLPALGSQRTLILLGGLGVIAGCLFNLSAVTSFRKWLVRAVPAALVLFAALLVPGDWVTRHVVLLSKPDSNVLLVREGIEETVVVTEEKTFGRIISRTLWTNGFSMSATTVEGQRYMRLMGHLPALMAAEAKKALLICYGVGNTLRALTAHRSFERIDVVELSGQVINADRFFHPFNRRALEDPRVSLHLSDGRNWLLRLGETYDVITCEPPPPTHAGVVSLYSRQYYELCRRRLSSGGIVCQWLPVNQMPYHEGLTLVRAFLDVFPHASLWFGSGCDLILLGSCGRPLEIDISRLASRAAESSVAGDLEAVGVQDIYQLLALLNAGPAPLRELVRGVRPTTDNNPWIEYPGHAPEKEKVLALCRMSGRPQEFITGWVGVDSASVGRSLDSALRDAARLREYAVALGRAPDGALFFRTGIPLLAPLLDRMNGNRYLLSLLGVDISVVAAAFRVSESGRPVPGPALKVIGKHFFYKRDLARSIQCFEELERRKELDPESGTYLVYLRNAAPRP